MARQARMNFLGRLLVVLIGVTFYFGPVAFINEIGFQIFWLSFSWVAIFPIMAFIAGEDY